MSAASSSPLRVILFGQGHVGSHLANAFLNPVYAGKVALSLFVRRATAETAGPKKDALDSWVKQGAQLIYGDFETQSVAELAVALKGQQVLVSAVTHPGVPLQASKLIPAAKAAGVRWFIPSEFGFDSVAHGRGSPVGALGDNKIAVIEAVQASGLDWTIVCAGGLAEFQASSFFGVDLAQSSYTAPGSFDNIAVVTALADVGAAVADAVVTGRGRNIKLYTGERMTYRQIADAIDAARGTKLIRTVRSVADIQSILKNNPSDIFAQLSLLYAQQGPGLFWTNEQTYAAQHGLKTQSFADFAKENFKTQGAASDHPLRVAIVGSTGRLGSAITESLLQQGKSKVQVSLLLRSLPASAPASNQSARLSFVARGARLFDIDVESASVEQLAGALAHTDVLLSTVGVSLLKDGQLKLVEAAKRAGVRRFIPSEFGFDMGLIGRGCPVLPWEWKLDVQAAVQQSGLEWTFIESGLFGEYALPFTGVDSASHTITAPGSFDTRISISPLADVGAQVADLLVSGRGRNETVYLSTVNYSWSELHAALERATGHKWSKLVKSKADFEAAAKANEQDWVARVSLILIAGQGTNFKTNDTYAHKHSIQLGNFDQFLRTHLAAGSK